MGNGHRSGYLVAVVGAGPAGLFAAKQLAAEGVEVVLLNRDIKPGGLAEYGIYPDKLKMKEGLRNQFRQILALPHVSYYGNVMVGAGGDLTLEQLHAAGFQAILVTAGAQGTKRLGMPGEDLVGVYHAKDLVYHYNHLPPFSQKEFAIGRRVAVIGAGNVMLDITRYLTNQRKVDQVITVVRRGPNEVKYDRKELEAVIAYLDLSAFEAELKRTTPLMQSLGQDPAKPLEVIHAALPKAEPRLSDTRFTMQFLASPVAILDDGHGRVAGIEVEENTLVQAPSGEVKARGTGVRRVIEVDTVIFAIGDCVDKAFGLPVEGNSYIICNQPRFPVEAVSYEVQDPKTGKAMEHVFVAGWARQASTGLVGIARRDGTNGAKAVLQYLLKLLPLDEIDLDPFCEQLSELCKPVISSADLARLFEVERQRAELLGVEEFKFDANEDMLEAMAKEVSG